MIRSLLLAALLVGAVAGVPTAALRLPAAPDRRVNDYAGALSETDRSRLEQKLAQREGGSTNQIVVAIFKSLEGESLEDFSVRLAQAWRVGQKGLDNGVVFVVFVDDRKMRLEVGYGLESALTDAVSSAILRNEVAPRFREGRMADGIAAGLDAIDQAIAGTYARSGPRARSGDGPTGLPVALVAGLAVAAVAGVGMALNARAQRRRGWTAGQRGWTREGSRGVAWPWIVGGGGGFGGGGGSGDSGGFSGGGGDFGGGGASGDW